MTHECLLYLSRLFGIRAEAVILRARLPGCDSCPQSHCGPHMGIGKARRMHPIHQSILRGRPAQSASPTISAMCPFHIVKITRSWSGEEAQVNFQLTLDPMQKTNSPARIAAAMRGKCLSSPGPVVHTGHVLCQHRRHRIVALDMQAASCTP